MFAYRYHLRHSYTNINLTFCVNVIRFQTKTYYKMCLAQIKEKRCLADLIFLFLCVFCSLETDHVADAY